MRVREHVTTRDLLPDAADLLIDEGLVLADLAGGRVQHEVPLGIHFKVVGALDSEDDPVGVRARAYDDVVLQLPLGAVVDEVDAGVEVVVSHLGIRGHLCAPLGGGVADEVVRLAGQFFLSLHARLWVRADESDSEHRLRGPLSL